MDVLTLLKRVWHVSVYQSGPFIVCVVNVHVQKYIMTRKQSIKIGNLTYVKVYHGFYITNTLWESSNE